MPAKKYKNGHVKKAAMIKALEDSLGVVSPACKAVGLSRNTHYEWIEKDDSYKKAVESISNIALDFAESKLYKQMQEGNTTAIIFYLKTKGKKRGYYERQDVHYGSIEGENREPIQIEIIDPNTENSEGE